MLFCVASGEVLVSGGSVLCHALSTVQGPQAAVHQRVLWSASACFLTRASGASSQNVIVCCSCWMHMVRLCVNRKT
jgi:hypothetical protein